MFAEQDGAELLEIRWQGLRDLMRYDEALRKHIDRIYRERALETYLRGLPMFSHLNDAQLQEVMRQTEFATFGDYDWSGEYKKLAARGGTASEPLIVQEGDYPNGVVLVRAGFARLSQKFGRGERTLNYLGAGAHYGLTEIAHNWRNKDAAVPLQFTLRALGYAHVIIVPTSVMEEVVLPHFHHRSCRPWSSRKARLKADPLGQRNLMPRQSSVRTYWNFLPRTVSSTARRRC
jgi:hypothetical protein